MNPALTLDQHELDVLRSVADILLPGSGTSPAAGSLTDLDVLLRNAAEALGAEASDLKQAVATLPVEITWDSVKAYAETDAGGFDVLSTAVSGAYFMSTEVLQSVGYPTGPRKATRIDQAADELESGILDAVLDRGAFVRWPPAVPTDSQES